MKFSGQLVVILFGLLLAVPETSNSLKFMIYILHVISI